MDLKQLKQATQELPRVDQLVSQLKKDTFSELKKPLRELSFGQVINDKLASFAHHLVDLRIAQVTHDDRRADQIISTLLRDPHSNVKQLLAEVSHFDAQVSLFHESHERLLDDVLKKNSLEDSIPLLQKASSLRQLRSVPQKQKEYLRLLGKHFVQMSRKQMR